MFGSANFDNRSLELNDELNVAVANRDLAARLPRTSSRICRARSGWTSTQWRRRLAAREDPRALLELLRRDVLIAAPVPVPERRRDPRWTRSPTKIASDGPRPLRSVADRLSARRRRPHGALQLAVRAAARRHVRAAHRGHRRRALVWEMVAGIVDGLRWLGLDWDEGPDVGGPHAPVLPVAAARAAPRPVPSSSCAATARLLLLLHAGRAPGEARGGGSGRRRLDLRSHVLCARRRRDRAARAGGALPRAVRFKVPDGRTVVRRSRARPDRVRERQHRRLRHPALRRSADLSPVGRLRRHRHGDHPRRPRRRSHLQHAEARAAVRGARCRRCRSSRTCR